MQLDCNKRRERRAKKRGASPITEGKGPTSQDAECRMSFRMGLMEWSTRIGSCKNPSIIIMTGQDALRGKQSEQSIVG